MSLPRFGELPDPEQVFLDNLEAIDRILSVIARRAGFDYDDTQEFASWAKARLIENAYGMLRAFSGRSKLTTYLTVVLTNLSHDYRNARWGRWRPSAGALAAGPIGTRLEELLFRDKRSLREAIEIVRSEGSKLSDTAIARVAARLRHADRSDVPLDEAAGIASVDPAPDRSVDRDTLRKIEQSVREVVYGLSGEDAIIVRMRYWTGTSVADIARTLGLDQKKLYRRLESLHARLLAALQKQGIDRQSVTDYLDSEDRT
ncbi:MAG TPA: hypothetical protein VGM82_00240 [Gemmatimonadaceae bacterium]|jgi:RNA polymerase sigma factor (sigma-70 family)